MRDEETGSFWQQISGLAVSGPMKGRQLELVHSDELTFDLWKSENPQGTVLKPVEANAKLYDEKDWEIKMGKRPSIVDTAATGIAPRELVFGLTHQGQARAYPVARVLQQKLVLDRDVVLMVGPDNKSVRAFATEQEFFLKPGTNEVIDSQGAPWNFKGCNAEGKCLKPVAMLKDYWFDWHAYNPASTFYKR